MSKKVLGGRRKFQNGDKWEGPSPLYDTPVDCLFDDDPEDPRAVQKLNGLDKRDYDHWMQRQIDGGLASTGRKRGSKTVVDEAWICLDCGEDKTVDEMATEVPDLTAESGASVGSCKECFK